MARKRNKKNFSNTAFTLVELMVGAVILIITFIAILFAYAKCMELNEMSQNSAIAVAAVKTRVEQINNTAFNQILATYNNVSFTTAGLNGRGVSYVSNISTKVLQVTVTFCWKQKNGRVMGEDSNLNGQLNAGEDTNNNGILDSPVEIVTYIYNK